MQKRAAHPLVGYLLIACAAFLWASSANLAKAAFAGGWIRGLRPVDVLTLTQMRSTFSFVLLFPALCFLRGWQGIKLARKPFLGCLLLGAVGVAGSNFFYYYAISKTTVATAVVVQYMAPVYVLLIRVALREERFTRFRVAAVVSAVAGCALVVGIGSGASFHGNLVGLAAAQAAGWSFTLSNVAGGRLSAKIDPLLVMLYSMLGAALLWLPIHTPMAWVAEHYDARQWAFLLVFGVVSMLVPYTLFFMSLRLLDATRVVVTSCLEPVFAALFAWILLHEALKPLQVSGIVLVILATVLLQMGRKTTGLPAEV
jgi:drug/metabolite transporter (DMT)-like permease